MSLIVIVVNLLLTILLSTELFNSTPDIIFMQRFFNWWPTGTLRKAVDLRPPMCLMVFFLFVANWIVSWNWVHITSILSVHHLQQLFFLYSDIFPCYFFVLEPFNLSKSYSWCGCANQYRYLVLTKYWWLSWFARIQWSQMSKISFSSDFCFVAKYTMRV